MHGLCCHWLKAGGVDFEDRMRRETLTEGLSDQPLPVGFGRQHALDQSQLLLALHKAWDSGDVALRQVLEANLPSDSVLLFRGPMAFQGRPRHSSGGKGGDAATAATTSAQVSASEGPAQSCAVKSRKRKESSIDCTVRAKSRRAGGA